MPICGGCMEYHPETLMDTVRERGIPVISDYSELGIQKEDYREEKVFSLVDWYATRYGNALILYGGLTASSRIWGLKHIRSLSNDLDWVCRPEALKDVLERERLFYHIRYDILFSVVDNVPLSFAFGHIHDWSITGDFLETARPVRIFGSQAWCCAKEYTVALKLRRMIGLRSSGRQVFGKDPLDILNILAAEALRPEIPGMDWTRFKAIMSDILAAEHVSSEELLRDIELHCNHLSPSERNGAESTLRLFTESLTGGKLWKS